MGLFGMGGGEVGVEVGIGDWRFRSGAGAEAEGG